MTRSTESKEVESDYNVEKRIDFVFKVIGRFDFYINSTNAKASLLIAWNGAIVGSIILKFNDVVNSFQSHPLASTFASLLLFATGALSLLSIFYVFRVIFPFLEPSSKADTGDVIKRGSRLFFGDAAKMGGEGFTASMKDAPEELLDDLCDQAAVLAKGLNHKMFLTKRSVLAAGCSLLTMLLLLLCKVITR